MKNEPLYVAFRFLSVFFKIDLDLKKTSKKSLLGYYLCCIISNKIVCELAGTKNAT